MTKRAWVAVGMIAAGLYACQQDLIEPNSDGGVIVVDASKPLPDAGSPKSDAAIDSGGPKFDAGTNATGEQVMINEISGGDEWVELVNAGDASFDLTGYIIADRDKDTGEPKLAESVKFPQGTTLTPGAYLIVRGGGTGDAGRACPDGGQTHCFNADFGISNKSGETIFFLAPDGGTAGKVVYPPDAASGGQTYSRIPSGVATAGFQSAPKTPGAPNVP
ncbi:MAG: lamin tail domain-containing protein [Polyangiaceae bacterium]